MGPRNQSSGCKHLCQLSHLHNLGFVFEIIVVRRKGSDLFSTFIPCLSVDKLLFHFVFSFLDPDSFFPVFDIT